MLFRSDGLQVKFDGTGTCEVKDSVGQKMLESYPSFIFSEDFEEVKVKTPANDFNKGLAEQLNRELSFVKESLESKTKEIESITADKEAWAEKAAELFKEKEEAVKNLEDYKTTYEGQVKTYELKIELINSTKEKLRKMCQQAEFVKEDWDGLDKEKLVDYVLSKS